tara:strand:+ start:376 stop:597 length:222 start_codon:yes stop_codon:yes gene_type:complete
MGHDESPIIIEQSIDNFEGTKSINVNASEGMSDVEAGIQFIYDIKYHTTDIAIATAYGLFIYLIIRLINKITS